MRITASLIISLLLIVLHRLAWTSYHHDQEMLLSQWKRHGRTPDREAVSTVQWWGGAG